MSRMVVLCALVFGAIAAAPAGAQAPQRLVPSGRVPEPAGQAAPAAPAQNAPAGPSSLLPVDVNAAPLAAIDPDSVGTLTREEGGLGVDMWAGTGRGLVEKLLPELPVRTVSPALRDLMRRVLLTAAQPPQGDAGGDAKTKSLLAERVSILSAMGDAQSVEALLRVAPTRSTDPALLRAEADMLFLESDNARLCALVASQSGTTDAAYWRKANIFCQALAGEHDRAALGANLLRERNEGDRLFFDLLDTIIGYANAKIDTMAAAQPLHFAMARAAKIALPADVVGATHPAILRTVATAPSLSVEMRLDAAERAEATGVIATKTLRDIYAAVPFTSEQMDKALSIAQTKPDAQSRALLYRRAVQERVPEARAQIINQALTQARGERGRYQTQARVYRDLIAQITPSRDLLWLAPEASRALLVAGEAERLRGWLDILRASAVLDENSARLRDRLMPLARMAGAIADQDWSENAVAAWVKVAAVRPDGKPAHPDDVRAQSILLFDLLEALGDNVTDAHWEKTIAVGATVVPNAAIWRQLNAAAISGRIGETLMLSAIALGSAPLGESDPMLLRFVIESLRGAGMVAEARAIALEAAISGGL